MKKKYKWNYKKFIRNIIFVMFIILLFAYFKNIDKNIEKDLTQYDDFVEYVKSNNMTITKENYNKFLLNEI